jgi:DNA-binding NarL/FixJ family response regulator
MTLWRTEEAEGTMPAYNKQITLRISTPTISSEVRGFPVRIVVVDDSSSYLDLVCSFLKRENLVEIAGRANDGAEALQAVAKLHPTLVLMDVNMPRMNGLEAAALLTEHSPGTKIILMSADESPCLREACHECGADAFIPKTHFIEEFAMVLGEIFS